MTDCPGIEVAKTSPSGKAWYAVGHCSGCQENAQLHEALVTERYFRELEQEKMIQLREQVAQYIAERDVTIDQVTDAQMERDEIAAGAKEITDRFDAYRARWNEDQLPYKEMHDAAVERARAAEKERDHLRILISRVISAIYVPWGAPASGIDESLYRALRKAATEKKL